MVYIDRHRNPTMLQCKVCNKDNCSLSAVKLSLSVTAPPDQPLLGCEKTKKVQTCNQADGIHSVIHIQIHFFLFRPSMGNYAWIVRPNYQYNLPKGWNALKNWVEKYVVNTGILATFTTVDPWAARNQETSQNILFHKYLVLNSLTLGRFGWNFV